MNRHITYFIAVVAMILSGTSCIKEKLELTYTNQESKIDQYINSNKYTYPSVIKLNTATVNTRYQYTHILDRAQAKRLEVLPGYDLACF